MDSMPERLAAAIIAVEEGHIKWYPNCVVFVVVPSCCATTPNSVLGAGGGRTRLWHRSHLL